MMTLIMRLCALCAMCALFEMVTGDSQQKGGIKMIGGLLMLHLVISGGRSLIMQLTNADGLQHIFQILMQ